MAGIALLMPVNRAGAGEYEIDENNGIAGLRPQLEALDLAGRGLWQLAAEFKPARILKDRELLPAVVLERLRQSVIALVRRFQHHERLRLDQRILVGPADDRGQQFLEALMTVPVRSETTTWARLAQAPIALANFG